MSRFVWPIHCHEKKLADIEKQRITWLQLHPAPRSEEKEREYWNLFGGRIEQLLDEGSGGCLLKEKRVSQIVQDALLKFDGIRYELGSWVIMPNHVHVLVRPLGEYSLPKILHSWKSYTATKINRLLNRSQPLWQKESYDHIIRSQAAQKRIEKYIDENPIKAKVEAASSRLISTNKRQDAASTFWEPHHD
ncbi:transposase [Oscillatoria amoena NRMC-F 0135]|nr:transposase [Oscillatoria amoena NRMC-F 0135]